MYSLRTVVCYRNNDFILTIFEFKVTIQIVLQLVNYICANMSKTFIYRNFKLQSYRNYHISKINFVNVKINIIGFAEAS